MSLFKSLTLLLVAAIANPMCCCLSFAATDFDESPPVAADPHACCKLAEGSSSQGTKAPDGDHDCPHEEIKLSQINDSPSEIVSASKGSVAHPVALLDASCIYASPAALAQWDFHSRRISSPQAPSGKSYSQAYCVFIL